MRLVSVNDPLTFAGTFASSSGFSSVQPLSLESGDSTQVSSNRINATFNAWPGGDDGVNFSIASSADLCLRDSGSSSSLQVYVGNSTTPSSLPLDLSGTGACSGGTGTTGTGTTGTGTTGTGTTGTGTTGTGTTGGKTTLGSHPGHYLGLLDCCDSQSIMSAAIKPGVKGFVKRYLWSKLEPTQGNYDFSEIQSDLNFVAGQGLHLIVMVENKTFKNLNPMPPYLQGSQYVQRNRKGGYTAIYWNSYVATRFKAVLTALGNRFDGNVAFEGVIPGSESAPGLDDSILNATGYTPEKYRDALIDVLTTTAKAVPKSRVFWFMNYLPRNQNYIANVAQAVSSVGVVMGGPDVEPDNSSLVNQAYPFYGQFQNKMDLFSQVEDECYSYPHKDTSYPTKYWTPSEMFRYARDSLHVKYMFWIRIDSGSGGYGWTDALPVIANNPVFNQ